MSESPKCFRLSDYEYKIFYKDKSWALKAQNDEFDVEFNNVREFVCKKTNNKWYDECWIQISNRTVTCPENFKQRITNKIENTISNNEKIISICVQVKFIFVFCVCTRIINVLILLSFVTLYI